MAYKVTVVCLDGKQWTQDENHVTYQVGTPSDVLFYMKDGILYAQWWNTNRELISVPAMQLISID